MADFPPLPGPQNRGRFSNSAKLTPEAPKPFRLQPKGSPEDPDPAGISPRRPMATPIGKWLTFLPSRGPKTVFLAARACLTPSKFTYSPSVAPGLPARLVVGREQAATRYQVRHIPAEPGHMAPP